MILCIGTTPAAQRVMIFRGLALDEVNRAVQTLDGAAGKSVNVAKVLKALGEEPVATGFLGGDYGEFVRTSLVGQGIEVDFVTVVARTRLCVTLLDESTGRHAELVEEGRSVIPAEVEKLRAVIGRRIGRCRAVVMSGTLAPGCPGTFYSECTRLARQAGALAVVDARGAALVEALAARPGLVKPNRSELAATVGRELADEPAVRSAMRELVERGTERVVVTAGTEPALAMDGQGLWRISVPRVAAVNPIGSGDAFTAALTWRLVRGDDLGEACRWGCAAGAANALTPMPGEVRREDVERLAREVELDRI